LIGTHFIYTLLLVFTQQQSLGRVWPLKWKMSSTHSLDIMLSYRLPKNVITRARLSLGGVRQTCRLARAHENTESCDGGDPNKATSKRKAKKPSSDTQRMSSSLKVPPDFQHIDTGAKIDPISYAEIMPVLGPKKRAVRRLKARKTVKESTPRILTENTGLVPERMQMEFMALDKFKDMSSKICSDTEKNGNLLMTNSTKPSTSTSSERQGERNFFQNSSPSLKQVATDVVETKQRSCGEQHNDFLTEDEHASGPNTPAIHWHETPGERVRRLFQEKRARGLAKVRGRFTDQKVVHEVTPSSHSKSSYFTNSTGPSESMENSLENDTSITEKKAPANKSSQGETVMGLPDNNSIDPFKLIPGEYVVHRKFGIGRFLGVRTIPADEAMNEASSSGETARIGYLFIEYADGTAKIRPDKARCQLYRYASPGAIKIGVKPPKLSRIRDRKGWIQRERNTEHHIRQLVMNQMLVYLQRLQCMRQPYEFPSEENYEQFDESFAYRLTPDQASAIDDCYEDLTHRDTPMDRIVVGDVGFGKTEVAMRAVFLVYDGGGQTFVLAPTTVLAKQHAANMAARLRPFGACVELLTRNIHETERKAIMKRWKDGRTHVIVGTHGLLNLPLEMYAPLKMLVIDEEQRFGVKHKDQISALKSSVDVLTLSATPIPRTLHMAIAGFRDASLVTTPPPERRPIHTILQVYDQHVLRNAVKFELDRGGQVFYVVPRIQMMDATRKRLNELFPKLNILELHGQMKGENLDNAMDAFASGEADILLCTTIVESGLDIPNVNTIIIEEVQQFGLASLYQLRGRVGRAGRQAYAYMFHAELGDMRKEAQERLLALEECCGLGEGFKLAERDMAIRGVGTIFGDKQSGEVDNIGADLYLELLFRQLEKIEKLRLNPIPSHEIRTPNFSQIPELSVDYLVTQEAREVAGNMLARARNSIEIDQLVDALHICFGEAADTKSISAINFHRMRTLAGELGVFQINFDVDSGLIDFAMDASLEVKELLVDNLDDVYKSDLSVTSTGLRVLALAKVAPEVSVAQSVNALRRILDALPSFVKFL
jgi:transcription-repair coupling factor